MHGPKNKKAAICKKKRNIRVEQGMDLPKPQAEFKLMTLVIKLRNTSLDHLLCIKLMFFMFYAPCIAT